MKQFSIAFVMCIVISNCYGQTTEGIADNLEEISDINNLETKEKSNNMKLGVFSNSLSVKDLTVSKEFYESIGFEILGGQMEKNYLIMKNDNAIIGLFQGMFEGNIMTFNPGWDENAQNVETFDDVREIQKAILAKGIKLDSQVDEKSTSGPGNFILKDPDGNVIFFDQHR